MQLTIDKGFTLFEVLVYIGLFSIIMAGTLGATFQLINGGVKTRQNVFLEQEASFIFRKIDWALNGNVSDVSTNPPSNNQLFVDKSIGPSYTFFMQNKSLRLDDGTTDDPLTSATIDVTNFDVTITPPSGDMPESAEITFELDGRPFATSKRFIRS